MTYKFKLPDESAWAGLIAGAGGLTIAVGKALGWDADLVAAIVVAEGALIRFVFGFFIPTPAEPAT